MVHIEIDIACDDRDAAHSILRDIATDICLGKFSASCDKKTIDQFGGTIFVIQRDDQ